MRLPKDPKVYVQTTLDVHKKYNALVMSAFNNDAGFVAALDKVGVDFCLQNFRGKSDDTVGFWCLLAGVRSLHQQQRSNSDGPVVQQVSRAAGPILRLLAEEEVGHVIKNHPSSNMKEGINQSCVFSFL